VVLGVEQSFGHQLVEVEPSGADGHADRGGRLLTPDELAAPDDVLIEGAPGRVGEGADPGCLSGQIHERPLSKDDNC
jgi:hypothetical protein